MSDVMPFGKHKGKSMESIPLEYLMWCAREMTKCPMLVLQEIDRRGGLTSVRGRSADKYRRVKESGGLTFMGTFVGRDYPRLKLEFDRAGGAPDECPFDTDDHKYSGPTMSFVGGQTVVVPSEFPQEIR